LTSNKKYFIIYTDSPLGDFLRSRKIERNEMEIAVIKTGGKQYKVSEGTVLKVEKLNSKDKIEFNDILNGKKVSAEIIGEGKSEKVRVLKFHSKKRYKRVKGHRQGYTEIKITGIK